MDKHAHPTRAEPAPWWNEECAQWHAVVGAKMLAAHRQSKGSEVWKEFREARQELNRVRRHAGDV